MPFGFSSCGLPRIYFVNSRNDGRERVNRKNFVIASERTKQSTNATCESCANFLLCVNLNTDNLVIHYRVIYLICFLDSRESSHSNSAFIVFIKCSESTLTPCTITEKCKCAPLTRPVLPLNAMICPFFTRSPTATFNLLQ